MNWREGRSCRCRHRVELSEEGHDSSDIEQKIRTFRLLADYLERVLQK
jgi:hypothetical protein